MGFIKKHKNAIFLVLIVLVAVAACIYVMLDTEDVDVEQGNGTLIGQYDISESGDGKIIASLYKNGVLDIQGNGEMKDFKDIPWVEHVRTIREVNISAGVSSIGNYAFYHCTALLEITLPEGIISIGQHAFDGSGLNSIVLPDSLALIDQFAFDGVPLLELSIPNGVTEIGYRAFRNCEALSKVTLGEGLEKIGDGAFFGCKELKTVNIPSKVFYIGENAFYGCAKLEAVTFTNVSGWYTTKNKSASEGEPIIVLNSSDNARNLADKFSSYFWKRTAK